MEPQLMFADRCSDWVAWFAWRPVRTFDKRWVWLRKVQRAVFATKPYLDGPHFEFTIFKSPATPPEQDQ